MTLPGATTRINDQSSGVATGSDLLAVWAPVPMNADGVPRLYSNASDIYTAHGYSEGLEYCALHFQETGRPVLFVPLAIATDGAVSDVVVTGNTGTSVVSVTAGADGALAETDGILKVVTGGTIGTDQIELSLSLDGGRVYKRVLLGTANSYTIPYVGLTLAFAAGTLVAGDTAITWHSSAPLTDGTAIAAAKTKMAAQQLLTRRWLLIGDLTQATDATAIKAAVDGYETTDERYTLVKCALRDKLSSEASHAVAINVLATEFASVTSDPRIDLGYGRGAMLSPITGYKFRRSVQWADMLLAYKRDMRTTTWWKALGPVSSRLTCGFDLNDADGQPYEHDERTSQGAIAARFTCARTWGNGPVGAFIAKSLTRAEPNSVLVFTHNADVVNLYQTVVQQVTEEFAGATLVLQPADSQGRRFATAESLKEFETKVNSELARYLLSNIGGEGQRASVATWRAATGDDFGVVDAVFHGYGTLEVNGTIVRVATAVAVR